MLIFAKILYVCISKVSHNIYNFVDHATRVALRSWPPSLMITSELFPPTMVAL